MRSHAFVFLCLVIGARAASINLPEEKKLDALEDVELDAVKEPETIKQIAVSEVENNFRNAEIPVCVVDEQQLKKIDENSNDYVPDINDSGVQRRVELDLKNPGPPQRQEHETQNPGHYSDKVRALDNVKEKLEETQQVFKEQLKTLTTNFETLIQKSENLPIIQQKIQNLKSSFHDKFAELNNTIQSYIKPSSEYLKSDLKPVDVSNKEIENIESNLRKVQINFDSGINILSEGVQVLALRKDEDELLAIKGKDNSGASPAAPSSPSIPVAADTTVTTSTFTELFSTWSNTIYTNLSNIFPPLSNFWKPTQSSSQSGSPSSGTSSSGSSASGSSASGSSASGSSASGSSASGSAASSSGAATSAVLADVPQQPQQQPQPFTSFQELWQNVVNTFSSPRPGQQANQVAQVAQVPQAIVYLVPAQPSNSVPVAAENSQPKSVDVQNVQPQPQSVQPQPAHPQAQAQPAQTQIGPIQQMLQNNPIIRGMQNAIQRVQPTTANPSKPREKAEEPKEDRKGGYYGGNYNNKGDNNECNAKRDKDAVTQEVTEEKEIIKEPSSDATRLITSSEK